MALLSEEDEVGVMLNLGTASLLEENDEKALSYFEQAATLSSVGQMYEKLCLSVAEEELKGSDTKERLMGRIKRLVKVVAKRTEGTPVPEESGLKGAEEKADFFDLLYWKE